SGFRKHRHMMDARKLLINLLYPASAQSSEVPGWSHREIKNPPARVFSFFSQTVTSPAAYHWAF
ncbi:hypothetical protein ACB284_21775, partial [Serratia marcescens]